jgi:hypothetical protein
MGHVASIDWSSLAPYWVSLVDGTAAGVISVTDGGRKIQSTDGNNGANARGFVKGTARGAFKIQFILGYSWGWSELSVANVATVVQSTPNSTYYQDSSYNGIGFFNNSSNNAFRVYKLISGTSTTLASITGLNDVMVTLWRDTSNVVKFHYGTTTTTVGTYTDHWCFISGAQSPSSTELISAHNLADAAS